METLVEGFWSSALVAPVKQVPLNAGQTLLDPDRQRSLVPAKAIAEALRMPAARIVVHDSPLPRAQAVGALSAVDPAPLCLGEWC